MNENIKVRTRSLTRNFTLPQWLLYSMSKDPASAFVGGRYNEPTKQWNKDNALDILYTFFSTFDALVKGRRVLDYGCGDGFHCYALALELAECVLGVDINERRLGHAIALCQDLSNVSFSPAAPQNETFDVALSLNAFEHFPQPELNLAELTNSLKPGGKLLLAFGPPWFAPYGSHMHFFTSLPWVNLFFSERTVFKVRELYRDDGATGYFPDVSKVSIRRFEKIISQSGLIVEWLRYQTVLTIPLLNRVPLVRELFINNVSCILVKPQRGSITS